MSSEIEVVVNSGMCNICVHRRIEVITGINFQSLLPKMNKNYDHVELSAYNLLMVGNIFICDVFPENL